MKHLGTKLIETDRLLLRPFCMEDSKAAFENWCSDPEVTKYLTWPTHSGVSVTEAVLREWVGQYNNLEFYQWAIVQKEQGSFPIGSISVVHKNDAIRMAHVGYCIGRKWWKQGITSEALDAVIHFLICEVGTNRVESRHDPRNPNSGRVMQKCGMKLEGTMRQADHNNQGICDYMEYAILAEEYRKKME